QSFSEVFAARDVEYISDEDKAQLKLDIAGAYAPEAGITHWYRTIRLNRGKSVEIEDDYELDHVPASLMLSLLTASIITTDRPGELMLIPASLPNGRTSAQGVVHYDAD